MGSHKEKIKKCSGKGIPYKTVTSYHVMKKGRKIPQWMNDRLV
jgi:hypothetical protein